MNKLITDHILINGRRIAYGIHGKGEPIILIHGTPSSSYIWRNVVPQLQKQSYQIFTYDLLGFGDSERPYDTKIDTSVTGQVPILLDLIKFWQIEKAHIVAHDIGGAVAQRFCLFHPEYVKDLTLIDTVSFDSWPSKRTKQQMAAGLEKLIKAPEQDHHNHFRDWLLSTVVNKEKLEQEALETYLNFICGSVGQASFFQHQVMHYDPRHTEEISDRLHELSKMPVQIIWGEEDAWQVTDWAYKLHAAIPNSTLHILPDCGHFAMEDQPDKISKLILSFIGCLFNS